MKRLGNENGAALIFVLLLSVVALITSAGLLYMVARGGFLSGQQKRYATALAAGRAGAEIAFQLVADRGDPSVHFPGATLDNLVIGPDLVTKLTTATSGWAAGVDNSSTIDPGTPATYDTSFEIGTAPAFRYRVYTKVVDTVVGNSAADAGLIKGGVVTTVPGEVTVMNIPFLYTIEELSENAANPNERSKISILYQY